MTTTRQQEMRATEKLVEYLQSYLRAGFGTYKTKRHADALLNELQELRQYFYNQPIRKQACPTSTTQSGR